MTSDFPESKRTSLGSSIRFGLWIYNNAPGAQVCPGYPAKLGPALNQAAQLSAAFPAKAPGYNTPTALALRALSDSLPTAAQAKDQELGPQKILLATDGQPFTCQDPVKLDKPALDYAAVVEATRAADAKDIDLYVMSLAPAAGDFAAHLDEVAAELDVALPRVLLSRRGDRRHDRDERERGEPTSMPRSHTSSRGRAHRRSPSPRRPAGPT